MTESVNSEIGLAHPVKFKQVKAGEWEQPVHRGYLMQCCDCGLVHRLDFRVVRQNKGTYKGKRQDTIQGATYHAQFRVYRDD